MAEPCIYEFGPFRLDALRRRLERDGALVPLSGKPLDILQVLIAERERILGREELLLRVWPDVIVEEANLTQNVSVLRKALGEGPAEHRYIVTVPGRGYRFVAPVRESPAPVPAAVVRRRAGWAWILSGLALGVLAAAMLAALVVRRPSDPVMRPGLIAVLPIQTAGLGQPADERGIALTDAVIVALTRVGVAVAPTRSILEFADPRRDTPDQAARAVGAEVAAVASVRELGGRLEASVQLIDARDGRVRAANVVVVEVAAADAESRLATAIAEAIADRSQQPAAARPSA